MSAPLSLTVLISGRGTNLQALVDAIGESRIRAAVGAVVCDRPEAAGLERARRAGLDTAVIDRKGFASREAFENDLALAIDSSRPDLIVLAGFMRVLDRQFVSRYPGNMINIHPSLLPAYRGLHTHRRVLEAGETEHGASVHFVTPELDGGPVISQVRLAVDPGQTPEELARRLLPLEHELLVRTVALFCQQRVKLRDEQVYVDEKPLASPLDPGVGRPADHHPLGHPDESRG